MAVRAASFDHLNEPVAMPKKSRRVAEYCNLDFSRTGNHSNVSIKLTHLPELDPELLTRKRSRGADAAGRLSEREMELQRYQGTMDIFKRCEVHLV